TLLEFPREFGGRPSGQEVFLPPHKIMGIRSLKQFFHDPIIGRQRIQTYLPVWKSAVEVKGHKTKTLFPPEWCEIAWIRRSGIIPCFNSDHILDPLRIKAGWTDDTIDNLSRSIQWDELRHIRTAEEAMKLLYYTVLKGAPEAWQRFQEKEPDTVTKLWQLCADAVHAKPIDLTLIVLHGGEIKHLTPGGLQRERLSYPAGQVLLPEISDPEWILEAHEESASE
ncbi:MAG: hypothetical protein OJI67_24635, partial [Prosthecobacter sp.]|nr:hypothetical protein [Prosthecobacter sp.]